MNPYRDATPRPRCTKCGMRIHKCLCKKPSSRTTERVTPRLEKAKGQRTLPIGEHAGSRVAYWMRWMRTEGIREGLMVEPDKNQSSQDQRRAYHGVDVHKKSGQSPKTVADGKSAGKGDKGGAEQPPRLSTESGVAENEVRGAQQ